ncbi:type I phosphomannose isomerase catalytic subunit [Halonatronum saccharophilum]|uniref:type I phosphomannose isomerase catalytic subunit n=1 Tax=Halonatronum saccharophilum TaxID=150060 RepID=UPI0004812428|nr:type I phosphomannose isomerase catalytic subunit [Halonatronum saccharophilum]
MYPLKFEPIYKNKVWGGRNLSRLFDRNLPEGLIGESWEIAAHQNSISIIKNGSLAGKSLMEAISLEREKILGKGAKEPYYKNFPLLIKILDANDNLSVQVHPDDKYAKENEGGELGKTEMWYVIDAVKGSKLVCGLKSEVGKKRFVELIKEGNLAKGLVEIEVKAGDVIYIPSGTVHSIGEGIVIAEIQQNSDTTYRVYDWNRIDQNGNLRELHIESALDVINFEKEAERKVEGLSIREEGYLKKILVASPYFITELVEVNNRYIGDTFKESFHILMALEGEGSVLYQEEEIELKSGETILVPAYLGSYEVRGAISILKSYIEDLNLFKSRLIAEGYSKEDLSKIRGL